MKLFNNINYSAQTFKRNDEIDRFKLIRAFDDGRIHFVVDNYKSDFLKNIYQQNYPQKGITIGITGESASGKSTITQMINNMAKDKNLDFTTVNCDNYFNDTSWVYDKYGGYSEALQAGVDLEGPKGFQLEQMKHDLLELKQGKTVKIPDYNFTNGVSTPQIHEVKPAKFILLEGIASTYTDVNDIKIYVDCSDKIKESRALARAKQRGQTIEQAKKMFNIVKKAAIKNIIPQKEEADLVLNGEASLNKISKFLEDLCKVIFKK